MHLPWSGHRAGLLKGRGNGGVDKSFQASRSFEAGPFAEAFSWKMIGVDHGVYAYI